MLTCTKCSTPLIEEQLNTESFIPCKICGTMVLAHVFPAYLKKAETAKPTESLIIDHDAGCFYHPKKKAVVVCSSCGRFLCALCDAEINGEHICFSCMEKGKKKKVLQELETHRTLYDSIALRLAILPLIIFYLTIITAPITVFIVFKYWKKPSSIIQRSKARFVVAMIIALAQIVGWVFFIYKIVMILY